MRVNNFVIAPATFGLIVVLYSCVSYAHPSVYSNGPPMAIDSGGSDNESGSYAIPQLKIHYAQLQKQEQHKNQNEQKQQQQQQEQQIYPNQHPNSTYFTTSKTSSTSTLTGLSSLSSPDAISVTSTRPSLHSAYIYKAEVPTHIEPEASKVVNAVKLASATSTSLAAKTSSTSNTTNNSNVNHDVHDHLSKKMIGSSVVTSVSVILNGNEPEYTDALGQKVPKPQASLQVASPINLLNPDRYEFYTFDEHGELVKRLMTMEEIQSIVANGDGEGPTIIHHGPIEDRDPEKNVQDIVNSVQSVLNKEVESNKNTSTESLPAFDTPDVSSSWSMILPAVFGNTGSVDIFSNDKPQQIVMTPDTEIIEASTTQPASTTTKKPKPNKKRPGQKRKSTTTTTEMTPQVIQEELNSQESVYTGMQQYENLAATMQSYDGFSQLHMQPIYHKLPEIETSTRRIFINNQEVVKKPVTTIANEDVILKENLAKKPASIQHKPLSPHRVKKPNRNHTTTKRPQTNKHKIKRKPSVTTVATPISSSTMTSTSTVPTTIPTTTIVTTPTTTSSTTVTPPPITVSETTITIIKNKKKKPTHQPLYSTSAIVGSSVQKPHLNVEKQKPSSKPHRTRPKPTKYQHITSASDLAAEATAHQDAFPNKLQHISYHKERPRPNKPITVATSPTTIPASTAPLTTVIFSTIPTSTTNNPIDVSLNEENYEIPVLTTRTTTMNKPESTTSVNSPSTSGTSGYPVPSYEIPTDVSIEQDAYTLQSFDQIMQTLKQPQEVHEEVTEKVIYGSLQAKDKIEETVNKHMISLQDNINLRPSPTLMPPYGYYKGNTFTTTLKYNNSNYLSTPQNIAVEDNSKVPDVKMTSTPHYNLFTKDLTSLAIAIEDSTISTELPKTTHILSEQENITKESEIHNYISTTAISEQSTLPNNDKYTTYVNKMSEDNTESPKIEILPDSLSYKEDILINNHNNLSYPIFVANLKPQLNMEVINPSEHITMSDFRTQAATVASTLIDGINTLPSDYSLLRSNDTNDEITVLMSDVINKMSNNNKMISTTKQTTSNDNRFSNQAQLDLSFLMSPTEVQPQTTGSLSLNVKEDPKYQQNYKPIHERIESTQAKDNQSEDLHKEYSTTEIPYTTTLKEAQQQELYMEVEETTTQSTATTLEEAEEVNTNTYTFKPENLLSTTNIGSIESVESLTTVTPQHKYENTGSKINEYHTESSIKEFFTEKLDKNDETRPDNKATLTINESDGGVTVSEMSLSSSLEQQKVKNESIPFFESDSSIDTTTLLDIISEETTATNSEDNKNDINRPVNLNANDIKYAKGNNESESALKDSKNSLQYETTTFKNPLNTDIPEYSETTTEISTESTEKYFNLIEIGTAATERETTEGLEWSTSSNKYTPSFQQSEPEYVNDFNISETKSDHIRTDQNKEDPVKLTTSKEIKSEESSAIEVKETHRNEETTLIYQMSEETSAELNTMISEEDGTDEPFDEDPYIKLGETTTLRSALSLENITKLTPHKPSENKTKVEQEIMLDPPKPIDYAAEIKVPQRTQPSVPIKNDDHSYEQTDEEDEEDQFGYHMPKLTNISTTTSTTSKTTTTSNPKIATTRRLNTLKPVSYFNKQPAYALYEEPAETPFNKLNSQSAYTQQKENVPPKIVNYAMATAQQRPMQRPPQLSNLMISSTQAARPPVKLEPSPNSSKGLEASLVNLDADILAFAKLCNELAFSYWKSITSEKISSARSLIMSPFALTSMLSMVFLGARGSTSGEMNDVLRLDDMVTFNPHLIFKNVTDSVEKSLDSNIATTAFVREIYSDRANGKVLQFFKERTQQLYTGHVEEVNFHVINDIIRRRTNLLVKRHTMGKVLEYLRTNSVWVNGPLATISANLYQTDCSHGSTQDRDGELFFQVHPTVRQRRLVPIPAVLFKSGFTAGYEPNLDATVVAFGTIQDTTSVIYVMPGHLSSISPSDNLDRLEKQLMETAISENAWSNLLTSVMDRPGIEVQIPRFSHRSFVNTTLGLQKMGIKGLFNSDYADLGGLTGSSNRDIYLSDMIQINTFSTCGEEKIADHHHIEMYPAPPLRKRNKDVDSHDEDEQDSSETIIDFGSLVQYSVLGRGFYDDLLDPKYLELPLPLRPRQARVPDAPRLKFDRPFLYFVRHNPTGMILFMGRFNPRLLP